MDNPKQEGFTLFGIGGLSNINFLGSEIEEGDLFAAEDEDSFVNGGFGVIGLKHNLIIGENTYLRTVIGGSLRGNSFEQDRYFNFGTENEIKRRISDVETRENRFTISSYINTKINAKQTIRAGILYENLGSDALFRDRENAIDMNGGRRA